MGKYLKYKLIILILILIKFSLIAQDDSPKKNEFGKIYITSILPTTNLKFSNEVNTFLKNKLNLITTQNGLGGDGMKSRFIITAKVAELEKEITSTIPQMYTLKLEFTFYIGDGVDGKLFASTTTYNTGVGETETKAYINGIRNLKVNNQKFRNFVIDAKSKIVGYYNENCKEIIADAKINATMKQFDLALYDLISIPHICTECKSESIALIKEIYEKKIYIETLKSYNEINNLILQNKFEEAYNIISKVNIDSNWSNKFNELLKEIDQKKCNYYLAKAKGAWVQKDIYTMGECFKEISVVSNCYDEANRLSKEASTWLKEKENKEIEIKFKEKEIDLDYQKSKMNLWSKVSQSLIKYNPPSYAYNFNDWR